MPNILVKKILAVLSGFMLILAVLIGSIRLSVFDRSFYMELYDHLDLANQEGISRQDLDDSIFLMLDYVENKRDDLDGTIFWKGKEQPTFNEKEISHMEDVKALWQNAKRWGWIFFALTLMIYIYFFWKTPRTAFSWICWGVVMGTVGFAVILILLGSWMIFDFTSFWIRFHHMFFTNELWILDPMTDFMIVICPENMFSSLIAQIFTIFVPTLIVLFVLSVIYLKRKAPIGFENL
ncbi:DUF1461 domain-containing protein [Ileibacterium valens]|uniref:DUF1461 domain-containing protein n=1 Tax=Ileibacterium valens TaxID=1862668 RepID=UPI0025729502|nr:DUF1461 domain-containing protein [Ileibacterium valens]